ncbi:MAG: CHASE2 domain-containing protein [Spirochaetales bacterium]|nr:CHASE2 domain-containing protein [Spirochaetales bacterium]
MKKINQKVFDRNKLIFLFILFIILLSFLLVSNIFSLFNPWDRQINDSLLKIRHALNWQDGTQPHCINIVIDDMFVDKYNLSYWNRKAYGDVIAAVRNHGPNLIACDIIFKDALPAPLAGDQNAGFINAVSESGKIYFPAVLLKSGPSTAKPVPRRFLWNLDEKNKGSPPVFDSALLPFDELLDNSSGIGSINLNPDPDGMTRKYPLLFGYENAYIPSYALLLLCAYTGVVPVSIEVEWGSHMLLRDAKFYGDLKKDVRIPIDASGCINVNYRGPWRESNAVINAGALLDPGNDSVNKDMLHAAINDSIAIVSDLSTGNRDYTPGIFEAVFPSVGTITAVIDSIMSENFLYDFSIIDTAVIFIMIMAVLCFIALRRRKIDFILGSLAGIFLFFIYCAFLFFIFNKILLVSGHAFILFAGIICIMVYRRLEEGSRRVTILEQKVSERTHELETVNSRLEDSNAQLSSAIHEMTDAIEQKTIFFHNLAHETKTPLTLIRNYMEQYVKKEKLTPELEIIQDNISQLCEDMNNCFDIEKFERGEAFYHHDQLADFSSLLRNKIALFKQSSKKKSVSIQASITHDLFTRADPLSMSRIIVNLLDNAVKYAPDNSVIKVSLEKVAKTMVFNIYNEGPKITDEQKVNIFKPYYQLSHEKRGVQGMGLGLPIVKKIITEVGGTIEVINQPEEGVNFAVSLLLVEKTSVTQVDPRFDASVHSTVTKAAMPEDLYMESRQGIMLVEDNLQLLGFLRDIFANEYNVICARNGKAALSKLEVVQKPDIIISDIVMDEMNGYDLIKELSLSEKYSDVPFIFLSARTSKNEKLEGLSRGAVDFISKPFSAEELLAKVKSILQFNITQKEININELKTKVVKAMRNNPEKDVTCLLESYSLTKKEKEVIKLLYQGLQYKEISDMAHISLAAVRKRIHNIYQKFNVQNRTELFLAMEKKKAE